MNFFTETQHSYGYKGWFYEHIKTTLALSFLLAASDSASPSEIPKIALMTLSALWSVRLFQDCCRRTHHIPRDQEEMGRGAVNGTLSGLLITSALQIGIQNPMNLGLTRYPAAFFAVGCSLMLPLFSSLIFGLPKAGVEVPELRRLESPSR